MTCVAELRCKCGADLYVSGDRIYVSGEAARFTRLHSSDGHTIYTLLNVGDMRGRDNGTPWWERSPQS
jgi:hypothetical protein